MTIFLQTRDRLRGIAAGSIQLRFDPASTAQAGSKRRLAGRPIRARSLPQGSDGPCLIGATKPASGRSVTLTPRRLLDLCAGSDRQSLVNLEVGWR
jgi:hypothetical protein